MIVYHGSTIEIQNPDLSHSRSVIDFGKGFYLTRDEFMAKKWACSKGNTGQQCIVNMYNLDLSGLGVVELELDKTWLDFVAGNRGYSDIKYKTTGVDVFIGPTADDKLYNTLYSYFEGHYTVEETIKYLSIAKLPDQIVLKTEKALSNLQFIKSKWINSKEASDIRRIVSTQRMKSDKLLKIEVAKDKNVIARDEEIDFSLKVKEVKEWKDIEEIDYEGEGGYENSGISDIERS